MAGRRGRNCASRAPPTRRHLLPTRLEALALELLLNSDYGNTLTLTNFTGETYIRGGNMTLNGAQAGKALRLADGANLQFNEKETAAWG